MTKRMGGVGRSDIIELRIYNAICVHEEYFRGKARMDNPRELEALFSAVEAKGLRLPKDDNWF